MLAPRPSEKVRRMEKAFAFAERRVQPDALGRADGDAAVRDAKRLMFGYLLAPNDQHHPAW